MKKMVKILFLIIISLLMIFSAVGCSSEVFADESYMPPFEFQIKSDKTKYSYGEEITIELLFERSETDKKDGCTYCIEIKESPYYEIIGDSQVITNGSETKEKYKGEYADFWYRAVFKIKVTKVYCGTHAPEITIKCVGNNDWLEKEILSNNVHSDDGVSYNFGIHYKEFSFTAVEDGVELTPLYSTITPTPWWKSLLQTIVQIINNIYYLITGKAVVVY